MKEITSRDRPYYELKTFDFIYRKFTQDVDEEDLIWHRDRNDREVTVLGSTDWQFQFEDSLPQQLQDTILIPKNTYHRLIKGTGALGIRILEH